MTNQRARSFHSLLLLSAEDPTTKRVMEAFWQPRLASRAARASSASVVDLAAHRASR